MALLIKSVATIQTQRKTKSESLLRSSGNFLAKQDLCDVPHQAHPLTADTIGHLVEIILHEQPILLRLVLLYCDPDRDRSRIQNPAYLPPRFSAIIARLRHTHERPGRMAAGTQS